MSVNWGEIDRLVKAHRLMTPTTSEESLLRHLRTWWCLKYTRPFKDPLLDSYTLQDLVYEYLTWHYLNPDNDPLEKEKLDAQKEDDNAWIKRMLEKKREEKKEPEAPKEPVQPVPNLPDVSTRF